MKTLIFLILCVLTGCATLPKWPYVQESSIIDYSEYAKKNFFITESESVNFNYTAIGSISAKVESGYEVLNAKTYQVSGDDIYTNEPQTKVKIKYGKYVKATPEAALEELYARALDSGANGIVGLDIKPITKYSQQYGNVIIGYFVTGMAIKN